MLPFEVPRSGSGIDSQTKREGLRSTDKPIRICITLGKLVITTAKIAVTASQTDSRRNPAPVSIVTLD